MRMLICSIRMETILWDGQWLMLLARTMRKCSSKFCVMKLVGMVLPSWEMNIPHWML